MVINKARLISGILGANSLVSPDSDFIDSSYDKGVAVTSVTMSVYSSIDSLPTSAATGTKALVTSNNTLYIYNSGWYKIAIINNFNPQWITQPNSTYDLAINGTATTITVVASDSDDVPITYIAVTDSDFDLIATVTHDSDKHNTWTVVPLDSENGAATGGTGTITFKASDGVNLVSAVSTFSLTFGPDWTDSDSITETILRANESTDYDQFGYLKGTAVSGDGNYIAVGNWYDDGASDGGFTNEGCVNIFVRSGSSWSLQQVLRSPNARTSGYFGKSVSLDDTGTYLLIGAEGEQISSVTIGRAYVYKRSGTTWSLSQALTQSDTTSGDTFGYSCSISKDGTVAAIGAYAHDGPGDTVSNSGSVYRFSRSGETWSEDEIVQSASPAVNQYFGTSVALSEDGTYMIVGAQGTSSFRGSVTLFSWNGTSWDLDQTFNGPSGTGRLGFDVDISDDGVYAISGAYLNTPDQAYIWVRSGSTWTQQQMLTASDANSTDNFGVSVALSGDGNYCVVGAQYEDGGSGDPISQSGAAYVFQRSGSSWSQIIKLTASDAQANDWFGHPVRMNTDATILAICAGSEDGGAGDPYIAAGAVYVYKS